MFKRHLTWFGVLGLVGLIMTATTLISGCVTAGPESNSQAAANAKVIEQPSQAMATPKQAYTPQEVPVGDGLQSTDCQKCHKDQPAEIDQDGRRHKYKVSCRDCHAEHPPWGVDTIPQCSKCHQGQDREHFTLPNCLACHTNPHNPLNLTIEDVPASSNGCRTCHVAKKKEFAAFPSKHAEKNCTHCHPQKHKVIKTCLECHEPHLDTMVFENCLQCHKPHSPLNITYAADTPSEFCGSCHDDIYQSLTSNPSKHGKLNCAFCHKDNHPTVPKCTDCHEGIHSSNLLSKFPDCLKCHADPHDLVI